MCLALHLPLFSLFVNLDTLLILVIFASASSLRNVPLREVLPKYLSGEQAPFWLLLKLWMREKYFGTVHTAVPSRSALTVLANWSPRDRAQCVTGISLLHKETFSMTVPVWHTDQMDLVEFIWWGFVTGSFWKLEFDSYLLIVELAMPQY